MSNWENVPAYVRVLDDLRRKIESGEIPPGAAIPSVAALARQHEVAATTVQKAIRALKAAGLVESVPGKETRVRNVKRLISRSVEYVSPVPPGGKMGHGPSGDVQVFKVVPPDDIAEKMGIEPDELAVCRRRVMVSKDDEPLEISTSYIPMSIAENTPLERPAKLSGAMPTALKRLGYPPRTCREWVQGRMPTSEESQTLRLPPGVPVLRTVRQTWTDGGRTVEVLEIVFSGERYELEYDLPIHDA